MSDEFSRADMIRQAREQLGIEAHVVAEAAAMNDNWYFDVEFHDDEITSNASLTQLGIIARLLHLDPHAIIEENPSPVEHERTLSELLTAARAAMQHRGQTVDAFSDLVGWEMAPSLAEPDKFREYTFDALVDLCTHLELDWREFLSDATAPDPGY